MKNLLIAVAAIFVAGCAGTVPMRIKSAPLGRTREQIQLDNLECSNMSRTNGPWLYGIGTAIMRSEAAKRYEKCMSARGYVVVRSNGSASHSLSATHQSVPAPALNADGASRHSAQTPSQSDNILSHTAVGHSGAPDSIMTKLEELKKLYKDGLITKKEYELKRRQILASL